MAGLTPARVQKACLIVSACIEAQIAVHAEQATELRNLLYVLGRLEPPARQVLPLAVASNTPTKGKRPQAGSLPARILDIIGEQDDDQVTFAQILAGKPGAPDETVRYNLYRLVRNGWIVATGNTTNRRYSLPTKKKGGH